MLFKQLPVSSFSSSFLFFFFFFQFLHLDQSNPPENVKAQITKNETLSSVSETAQALLTRLLVSSATYLIRHD